jgi:hypothetical protein
VYTLGLVELLGVLQLIMFSFRRVLCYKVGTNKLIRNKIWCE